MPLGTVKLFHDGVSGKVFMKIGIFNMTTLMLLMTCACVAGMSGCRSDQGTDGSSDGVVSVPHGYMARLEQVHDARMVGSGPGLFGLQAVGVGRTLPLPTSIVVTGLAAVIFGIGWGLTGYCPGTTWAAAGVGRAVKMAMIVWRSIPTWRTTPTERW